MTDETYTRRSRRAEKPARRRRRRRWPWIVGGIFLLLVAAGAGAVSVVTSAITVNSELADAKPLMSTVKDKVLNGQAASAQSDVDELKKHADKANEATTGPAWWLAEQIPGIGENLIAVRTITNSVSNVVDDAIVPAVALGDNLSPAIFKPVDGAVNLAAIQTVLPVIESAGTALTGAKDSISALKTDSLIGPVKSAVTQINDLVGEVEPAIATAKSVAPVLPALLGADGPRNYLLVFQNSAEVRPLGGIAGAQVLLTADQGRVSIAQEASGRDFPFESEEFANSHVGREARSLFLVPFGLQSQNNTLTPRVEVAADLTRSMWQNTRGVTSDTVVFIDPTALTYILSATGPITLDDGTEINHDNAVDLLLNGVYQQYSGKANSDAPDLQDAFFSGVAAKTFSAVMSGNLDIPTFVTAMTKGASERRVIASSTDPTVAQLIADGGFGGRMPQETDASHQVGIYLSDYQGSKMDYYLRTAMAVGQQTCADGSTRLRVQVTANNSLDPGAVDGLSIYVTGNSGNNFNVPVGDLRIFTYVYAPVGSKILSIDGSTSQADSFVGADKEYPVARGVIQAAPGETQTATIDIDISGLEKKSIESLVGPLLVQPEVTELQFTC
ncbi:DUF4012 domain-containing protein [Herbiconiux sp.]|uniref:DUF4012 domain-containing protein n=1 Tax=Herbiconiux sp. TaxID=1871186 RepID=UPI0025BAE673|nr:DUF4012 domain-containing protein [Herbiconiux sp.]